MTMPGDEVKCIERPGAIGSRACLGVLLLGAWTLDAEPVRAQTAQDKHHLTASAGNPFHTDVEVDRFDGRAEMVWGQGVGAVDPANFLHRAVADGDSGLLAISSSFSVGGPGDPIFVAGSNASGATIEETIDPGIATSDTVTVTASLVWNGSGSLANGGGNIDTGEVGASLKLDGCSVGSTESFSSLPSQSSDDTGCADTATNFGSAGGGSLTVTRIRDAAGIGSGTRFFVTANVHGKAGDLSGLEYFDTGEYEASGQLSIVVSGAAYEYSSPTFLTVPEPGDAALAAIATAAVASLARRRSVLA